MPYIEHALGKTYYQRRGRKTAKGLPLVCLHGGPGGHSRRLEPLFELADERQVYLYDQVGGGRSTATEKRDWTIPAFVRELSALVDAWELEEFHLFGASWGTTLALEYLLRRGKKVRSVVFQSPMFSTEDWESDANRLIKKLPSEERKVIQYCQEIGATDSEVYAQAMKTYYERHVCRNKQVLQQMLGSKDPNGGQIYGHMWGPSEFKATGTLSSYDSVPRLGEITQPSLVVCGEYDEAQPSTGKRYAKQLANGEFACIANASHVIGAEKPKALVKVIRGFVRSHD